MEEIREDYPGFNSEFGRLNRKSTGTGGACGILGMGRGSKAIQILDLRASSKLIPSPDVRVRAHACRSTEVLRYEERRPLSIDSGEPQRLNPSKYMF